MKRPRPHIPLSVRVEVAEREVEKGLWWPLYLSAVEAGGMTLGKRLEILLGHLPKGAQLDHDPALILREFNPETGKYTPDANDPAYLIYREPRLHLQKTIGRKADAEKTVTTKGSDIWLRDKFKRLENPSTKPRAKIPSRPFPKGRSFPRPKSRDGK
jgi:hypothetical protein